MQHFGAFLFTIDAARTVAEEQSQSLLDHELTLAILLMKKK